MNHTSALLLTNPVNIRYLSGFTGVSPEEREAYLLVLPNTSYLFTNGLYRETAISLSNNTLKFVEISRENPLSEELFSICNTECISLLDFEESDLTVAEYSKLRRTLKGIRLVPTQNRIESQRIKKTAEEIGYIRRAARLTDDCLGYIITMLKPGVTEPQIAYEIESFFRLRGAQNAFSPIVAFGKNTSMPHYDTLSQRTKKNQNAVLKSRDIVLIDMGARVNGYCADMTRMVFVGKPKAEWTRAYMTVLDAQKQAIAALESGVLSGRKLDSIARSVIQKTSFPVYPHGLGHGVGLEIHESPRISVKKDETLEPDEVITIEPGTYIEGSFGIRIEDLILLKKDETEILSVSQKEMIIL